MKYLIGTVVILASLTIGASGGYWYAVKDNEARNFAFDMAEMNFYLSYMAIQMVDGTDATREEAIRGHLTLIEKRKGHASPLFTEKVAATDSALSYAKLSVLAKKRGAEQEAQQLLDRAVSFCPQMGLAQCSSEKILSLVQQIDKQGIFGAGAK
jgi:hypothetical protein